MTDKVTLAAVANLIDFTTAATVINNNSAAIVAAIDNTLSLDGTSPNQMKAPLDMNSEQIINLSAPATATSPLRLQDLNSFIGGGTITDIPAGGTTAQSLQKTSNADYAVGWGNNVNSVGLSLPSDFTVTNSPVVSSGTLTATYANTPTGTGGFVRQTAPTITSPTLTTPNLGVATATSINKMAITAPATSSTLAVADGKVFTVQSSVALAGTDGTSHFLPATSSILARTDAGNTFTGHQTIEGVTSTGATGTGNLVFATSPTFTTPLLGTPTSGTLTNCTLPVGGVSGLGTGVGTFLATPTSANLASALTDETGTGSLVFANTPTLVTPVLGAATATSVNKVVLTAPGTAATLTIANNKTLTANNSLTLAGTDGTTMTFPSTTATIARTDAANTFTGHQTIEGVTATGATGTGNMVFATSPTLTTPALGAATATTINGAALDNLAYTAYTPTLAASVGTATTTSTTGRWKQIGKTVVAQFQVTVTTVGTAAGQMQIGLPTTPISGASNYYSGCCYNTGNNKSGACVSVPGSSIVVSLDATGTTWWASGAQIVGSIVYEAA